MSLISQEEYKLRRQRFIKKLPLNSIAIIPTAKEVIRNRDAEYPFRPTSDFYYLSGFYEPEAVIVLIKGDKINSQREIIFCRSRNKEMEIWTGKRLGPAAAKKRLGFDEAHAFSELEKLLPVLIANKKQLWFTLGNDSAADQLINSALEQVRQQARAGVSAPQEIHNPEQILHEMRLIKSKAEIKVMQQAADISAQAHINAMKAAKPGLYEYQLEAELSHTFLSAGSRANAYNSIVGSGENACILHYVENTRKTRHGDLVLIDAGCELDCYASDITRTFPINGVFSKQQAAIYQLVLDAQLAAIKLIKPGVRWNEPHDITVKIITAGLVKLGLLKGSVGSLIKSGAYREFYMHRAGHWLGMDVHDVGDYKIDGKWRPLKSGMVLTVEPGIYITPDNKNVDKQWRGIGIRIEDDVLVTSNGYKVLTAKVPKSIADIECLMAK